MSAKRHPDYYILDGNFVIQAEETLFRVHRSTLVKSDFWLGMLAPVGSDGALGNAEAAILQHRNDTEGSDDSNPLLVGHTAEDFSILLSTLYPSVPIKDYSLDELMTLIRLSDFYQFDEVHSFAVGCLRGTDLPPLEMLQWALKVGDREWEVDAYIDLCTTVAPIDQVAIQNVFDGKPDYSAAAIARLRDIIRHHLYAQSKSNSRSQRRCMGDMGPCNAHKFAIDSLVAALGYFETVSPSGSPTLRELITGAPAVSVWYERRGEYWPPSKPCHYCRSIINILIDDAFDLAAMRALCFKHVPWLNKKQQWAAWPGQSQHEGDDDSGWDDGQRPAAPDTAQNIGLLSAVYAFREA